MNHTVTMLESQFDEIQSKIFDIPNTEGGCFLICGESVTEIEHRFLVREIIDIQDSEYLIRERDRLSLTSACYVRAAKRARELNGSVLFVHSHPNGLAEFSAQDDREEPKLQEFFRSRLPGKLNGALVFTNTSIIGRTWSGGFKPMETIRVIGSRFRFITTSNGVTVDTDAFDRQIQAFGEDFQGLLASLHIGIIGCGGTGSAVAEQLARLGIGKISLIDFDKFEKSNVNRVFGSHVSDIGVPKVEIADRNIQSLGLGTNVAPFHLDITKKAGALKLRDCDIIFGCTDKEAPRSILVQLASRYYIPFLDLGVLLHSEDGQIEDVIGRVTTVYPGEACLFCRGRIDSERIRLEMLSPEERETRVKEGYAPELATSSPAVVSFTSAIASFGVNELLHRLSGFMGSSRVSTELLVRFHKSHVATNRTSAKTDCICSLPRILGEGDTNRFLGLWS